MLGTKPEYSRSLPVPAFNITGKVRRLPVTKTIALLILNGLFPITMATFSSAELSWLFKKAKLQYKI